MEVAKILSSKFDVVITNPPYLGNSGMSIELNDYVSDHFSISKTDLYSCFIDRNRYLLGDHGLLSMITQQSFMFLSSFDKLRDSLFA